MSDRAADGAAPRPPASNPHETLERAIGHMQWANARLFERLAQLQAADLEATEPGSDWSVAAIVHHLLVAAENYAQRLHGEPRALERDPIRGVEDLPRFAAALAAADERIRRAATEPGDELLRWISYSGDSIEVPRWTLIVQSVHHATEHRAQIAGALAAQGRAVVDLDAIDVWTYEEETRSARAT